jgi:hypothetical protein
MRVKVRYKHRRDVETRIIGKVSKDERKVREKAGMFKQG